ncbi:RNA polymerase sigma factor [Pedobacter frigoris]|uniref:Sigma-70 family RNA polymerase sigma factor n=1 Tax=Pedobacter frigoris TaxID=2571272 RepID=A0A4V5NZJ3_9SPHI|nr:sigma-70 family RNA polymerase sigma factor [Pedobacter frigoris]TKC08852.1 sigma-70 family RNA polymerase sigma factor [Pedobacter frigoris]
MMLHSDNEIIEGLKRGGSQRQISERDLYKAYFYLIAHGTKKYKISTEDAASAYSDTIISLIHQIVNRKFEGRSALKSYAYQIFSNKCVDLLRKETTNKRKAEYGIPLDSLVYELPDAARNAVQQIIAKDDYSRLTKMLMEVGGKCKQLLLFFEDGYSDKEIAGMTEYNSAEVVKTSRLRCMEKLRTLLKINKR